MKHFVRNRKYFTAPCFTLPLSNRTSKAYPALGACAFTLAVYGLHAVNRMPFMATSWANFKSSMRSFFETGLGGPGMEGIGIAIAVIGIVAAAISFIVHKFNPQSRMPGWVMCLVIGLVGALAMGGVGKPLAVLEKGRDLIYSWFGV